MSNRTIFYPNVELSGKQALGYASSVQTSAANVQYGHENQPAECAHVDGLVKAHGEYVMHSGYETTQAERDEHSF